MKKYLLTALLGVFAFVGAFASATDYTFTSSDRVTLYTPDTLILSSDGVIDSVSITEFSGSYGAICICKNNNECSYDWDGTDDNTFCFVETDSDTNTCSNKNIPSGTYYINKCTDYAFSSVVFSISSSSEGDSEESGTLLPTGTGALSGIIENLGTTISEFIPYLVFIGLGLLGAIIGFVAIKWLMNRVRAKVYGTFSGGRRR